MAKATVTSTGFWPADHPDQPRHSTPPARPTSDPLREHWSWPGGTPHLQAPIAALPEHQRLVLILVDVKGG